MPTIKNATTSNGTPLSGATLTTAYSGNKLVFVGATRPPVAYLYDLSTKPTTPAVQARLDGGRLPSPLPVSDNLMLKYRQEGEPDTEYTTIYFKVVAGTPAAGSIAGVLFNDDDADGVMDAGEKPTGVRPVVLYSGDGKTKLATVSSDSAGRYQFADLAAGTYRITRDGYPTGYACSNPNGYETIVLGAGEQHVSVNIGTRAIKPPVVVVPPPPAKPDTGNVPAGGKSPDLAWCGATIDASAATIPMLRKALVLGITTFRFFASGADDNGNFGGWSVAPTKSIQDAIPNAVTIGMYGRQEQSASQGRTAKPLTPEQQRAYWQQVAAKLKAAGIDLKRHWIELQNEYNANQYLAFGGSADKVTDERVAYMMREAQYAREALGPDAVIIGPSSGYLDSNPVAKLAWTAALVKAGILTLIDIWNDHVYMSNAANLKALLDGTQAIIGDKPWISTECNLRGLPLAKWLAQGPALVALFVAAKLLPCIYRLSPNNAPGGVDMIPLCLFDAAGNANNTVQTVWGRAA